MATALAKDVATAVSTGVAVGGGGEGAILVQEELMLARSSQRYGSTMHAEGNKDTAYVSLRPHKASGLIP